MFIEFVNWKAMKKMSKKKPSGYWKIWSNLESELITIINDGDGNFPTQKKLIEKGKSNIARAFQYYGGINGVKLRMGFDLPVCKTLTKWKDMAEWIDHGNDNDYNERTKTSLKESNNVEERSWHRIGRRYGWLNSFSFKKANNESIKWENYEQWKKHGDDNNYKENSPSELAKSENIEDNQWYRRGYKKEWMKDFAFRICINKNVWKNENEWISYGLENGFDKLGPGQIAKSDNKKFRAWYKKGHYKKWNKTFPFSTPSNNIDQLESLLEDYIGGNEHE
jgi:hypothetical protein